MNSSAAPSTTAPSTMFKIAEQQTVTPSVRIPGGENVEGMTDTSTIEFSKIDFSTLPPHPTLTGYKVIRESSKRDFEEFQSFCRCHNMRFKTEYDAPLRLIALAERPSGAHQVSCAGAVFYYTAFNCSNSGNMKIPLSNTRSTYVTSLNGSIFIPDDSLTVGDGRKYPNIVFEVGMENSTLAEFTNKLRRYITDTEEIMYAIGWQRIVQPQGVILLAIAFSRWTDPHLPLFVISFGDTPISPNAMTSLRDEFGDEIDVLCRGFGFNEDPQCTQEWMDLYTMVVPTNCTVCVDRSGLELFQLPNNANYQQPFVIDLFLVRQPLL